MENPQSIEIVSSLVPINHVQSSHQIAKKYWHIICKAEFLFPMGLQCLKVSFLLIWYDGKLYINIVFESIFMLPSPTSPLDDIHNPSLCLTAQNSPLQIAYDCLPLSYNIYELPECPRCLLGYTCNAHQKHN